jgi:hypothetical protein
MSDIPTKAKAETDQPKKRRRRRWKGAHRQVPMPEAMRIVGLDECEVAYQFDHLVDYVVISANDKLLFEVLRECAKLLNAYPPNQDAFSEPGPQIIFDIPRPVREAPSPKGPDEPEPTKAIK